METGDHNINPFAYTLLPSPFGQLSIVWQQTEKGPKVHRVFLPQKGTIAEELVDHNFPSAKPVSCPAIDDLSKRIRNFLKCEPIRFELDIVVLEKCPDDQKKVLMVGYEIPRGQVCAYGEVAKRIGKEDRRGAQNVGSALKNNPFPIIFPCHRVIKANGDIGEYQGGREMKRALLEMEGVEFYRKIDFHLGGYDIEFPECSEGYLAGQPHFIVLTQYKLDNGQSRD